MSDIQAMFLGWAIGGYLCFTGSIFFSLLAGGSFSPKEAFLVAFWPPAFYREIRRKP